MCEKEPFKPKDGQEFILLGKMRNAKKEGISRGSMCRLLNGIIGVLEFPVHTTISSDEFSERRGTIDKIFQDVYGEPTDEELLNALNE